MKKLDQIKNRFYFENNEPVLDNYGQFTVGLTSDEIDNYLVVRANTLSIKKLRKKFDKIVGINTCGMYICPKCKDCVSLMYRHDVLRFSDVLFGKNKCTYFD